MKYVLIVYHNNSGKGLSHIYAEKLREELKKYPIICMLYLSSSVEKMQEYFTSLVDKNYEDLTVVFIGGDGTLGFGIDALIKSGLNAKIATFRAGTVNDFASSLKMPVNIKKYAKILNDGKTMKCDIAIANDRYFINVASGGYFTHGLNTYSQKNKKIFGKLAYYTKNMWTVFKMKEHHLNITIDGKDYDQDLYFYLIMNSCSAGGFRHIGVKSKLDDGKFDFVGVRPVKRNRLISLFFKILKGKHATCGEIFYMQGKDFELSCEKNDEHFRYVDTDGNKTAELPLHIEVCKKKINLIIK